MKIISVNVGKPTKSKATSVGKTGINKAPQPSATIGLNGIEGDIVCDQKNHGGADQAIYIYSLVDYRFWEIELGRKILPGEFGENITISTMGETESDPIRIGDRYKLGQSVIVEITAPRIPCATFAEKMDEDNWIQRFKNSNRPGYYCRVINTGTVKPDDVVVRIPAPKEYIPFSKLCDLKNNKKSNIAEIIDALESPISIRMRRSFERRVASSNIQTNR